MKYYIAVEVEVTGPVADLTATLQRAYDGGAAGHFQVLMTHAPSCMVIFERETSGDAEYVIRRAEFASVTRKVAIENAAMQQLAAELQDGDVGSLGESIVANLRSGDAKCFDFGLGAYEEMAEFEMKPNIVSHGG